VPTEEEEEEKEEVMLIGVMHLSLRSQFALSLFTTLLFLIAEN
jgi:hypothetical protein